MSDKSTPLPAPAGMKWHVRPNAGSGYTLGLYPQGAKINDLGIYQPPWGSQAGALASVTFWNERQIRRASKCVLRALEDRARADRELARIREAVR